MKESVSLVLANSRWIWEIKYVPTPTTIGTAGRYFATIPFLHRNILTYLNDFGILAGIIVVYAQVGQTWTNYKKAKYG